MKTRVISALVAAALLLGMYFRFHTLGLFIVCSFVALIGTFEYSRLTFAREAVALEMRVAFFILSLAIYATGVWAQPFAMTVFALASMIFISLSLFTLREGGNTVAALQIQKAGLMGFVYCGVFPGFTVGLLNLESGSTWLLGLLLIVFAGDTFAYLTGVAFGRHKLLESVSPKKTIEGSIGGLIGSTCAGLVMGFYFIKSVPLSMMVLTALVTGAFAQMGDLFESLLKRVADVKDSGSIMPGHGGLLDRVDGVLFAAPVYYFLAQLIL